jgi:hypothetical protein
MRVFLNGCFLPIFRKPNDLTVNPLEEVMRRRFLKVPTGRLLGDSLLFWVFSFIP